MTLYTDLDIPPDADRDALTRAHRKAVKRHHPDAGGDREQFERVQRAWLVLSDPAKRERYDRTGQTDDQPDNELSRLANILVGAFDSVMSEAAEIMDRVDVIARMTRNLRTMALDARQKIGQVKKLRGQFERARKRLSFAGDGPDMLGRVLDERLQQAAAQIDAMEREAALIDRAGEHLKMYGWEFEAVPAPMYSGTTYGTTSTIIDAARGMGL